MRDTIERISPLDPRLTVIGNPEIALSAEVWLGSWGGEPAMAWGVIPRTVLSDEAYVWSWAWPETLVKCKKTFLRRSREMVHELHERWPVLYGLAQCRTVWLDHLGAKYTGEHNGLAIFQIGGQRG